MRFNSEELKRVFNYLLDDGQTTIGYQEFSKLLDEKRMGQDPFINNQRASWDDFNDPFAAKPPTLSQQRKMDDVMKIFEERKQLFDMERYKGKCSSPCLDDKIAMQQVGSTQLQDYKFKKMQNKYGSEKLFKNFQNKQENTKLPNVDKYYQKIEKQVKKEIEILSSLKNRSQSSMQGADETYSLMASESNRENANFR